MDTTEDTRINSLWEAALNGRLDIMISLREDGHPWCNRVCSYAAEGGHLDILKWLRDKSIYGNDVCPIDHFTYQLAAIGERTDVMERLKKNGYYS